MRFSTSSASIHRANWPKVSAGDYNLFRYCHNDPIDMTDPMGTEDQHLIPGPNHANSQIEDEYKSYNSIMATAQMNTSGGAISVASLAGTITLQLHTSVMNNSEAAGLYGGMPRTVIEGPSPTKIDVDGRGARHGDPDKQETSYQPNGKSLNADKDNYVVRSPSARREGVRLGDRAFFFANQKLVPAIVGDSGNPGQIEASLHTIHDAGIRTIDKANKGPVPNTPGGRDVSGSIIFYPSGQPGL